jgi:pilus assembly protein CpaE
MIYSRDDSDELDALPPLSDDYIAPAPRVSVQAFCENTATAEAVQSAGLDRRLAKAHLTIKMGGMETAIETYHSVPTPNVIILETKSGTIFWPASINSQLSAMPERAWS